jgi:hypothetical protein
VKPTGGVKVLAGVCVIMGLLSLYTAMTSTFAGTMPCPPLLWSEVAASTVRLVLIAHGLASLAVAAMLITMPDTGVMLLMAGLAWDVLCQLGGLAQGRMVAIGFLVVDAVLIGVLVALRKGVSR